MAGRTRVPFLIAILVATLPPAAAAQSDGVPLCDGAGTVVSKAVGSEQWSIQYDVLTNSANGIAYDPQSGTASFVSCFRVAARSGEYVFDCAVPAEDDPERWDTFAEGVSLTPDFFRLQGFIGADLSRLSGAVIRGAYDREPGSTETHDALFADWEMDDAVDEQGVLRGRSSSNGNPVTIQATFTSDRLGAGAADFFAIEYADDECRNLFFNARQNPPSAGERRTGVILGTGFRTGRNDDGSCANAPDQADLDHFAGVLRTQFDF